MATAPPCRTLRPALVKYAIGFRPASRAPPGVTLAPVQPTQARRTRPQPPKIKAYPVLDVAAYPKILKCVLEFSPPESLWALRGTCRVLRRWVDTQFGQLYWRIIIIPEISKDGTLTAAVYRDTGGTGRREKLCLWKFTDCHNRIACRVVSQYVQDNHHAIVEVRFCRKLLTHTSQFKGKPVSTLQTYRLCVSGLLRRLRVDTLVIHPSAVCIFQHRLVKPSSACSVVVVNPAGNMHLDSGNSKGRRVIFRLSVDSYKFSAIANAALGAKEAVINFTAWEGKSKGPMKGWERGNHYAADRWQDLTREIAKMLLHRIRVSLVNIDKALQWIPVPDGGVARQNSTPKQMFLQAVKDGIKFWLRPTGEFRRQVGRPLSEKPLSRLRFLSPAEYAKEVGHLQTAAERSRGAAAIRCPRKRCGCTPEC